MIYSLIKPTKDIKQFSNRFISDQMIDNNVVVGIDNHQVLNVGQIYNKWFNYSEYENYSIRNGSKDNTTALADFENDFQDFYFSKNVVDKTGGTSETTYYIVGEYLDNLQDRIIDVEYQIEKFLEYFNFDDGTILNLEERITLNEINIDLLNTRVFSVENDLVIIDTRVTNNENDIAALELEISELDFYTKTETNTLLDNKEDIFSKNTAFNKNFGTVSGTVSEGNHSHDEFTVYNSHIDDTSIHFTQNQISITESQISNLDKYTQLEVDALLLSKEDIFSKNTAFNKNFGTVSGTVSEGNHSHDEFIVYESHIGDTSIHFSQSEISITESQITDLDKYSKSEVDSLLDSKEDNVIKNTAYNKNFGLIAGTVSEGNHTHDEFIVYESHIGDTSIHFTQNQISITESQISDLQSYELISNKNIASGYAGLDSNTKIPLSLLPDTAKQSTYVVLDSTEREDLTNLIEGDKAFETSTNDSYIWDSSSWILMADADWENVNIDWINIVGTPTTISGYGITDAYTKTESNSLLDNKEDVFSKNTAFNKNFGVLVGTVSEGNHSHDEFTLIDSHINDTAIHFTQSEISITESQISDLDKYTQLEVDTLLDGKENVFTKNTGFNLNLGTTAGTVSEGNHSHDEFIVYDSHINDTAIHFTQSQISITESQISNLDKYTQLEVDALLLSKENVFTKNTAFNKNFGLIAGTVSEGNHSHDEFTVYDSHINDTAIHFTQSEISITESQISDLDKYTQLAVDTLLDGKVDNSRVLTDVPLDALFTDTIYDDTTLVAEVTLNTAKISFDNESSTRLINTSGVNTGDQDLSGYLLNTTDTLTGDLTVTDSVIAGGLNVTVGNGEVANFRNSNTSTDITMRYGYDGFGWIWKYEGSGSGNNNKHILYSEGAGDDDVQVYEITQDGKITFNEDSTFVGNVTASDSTLDTHLITQGQVNTGLDTKENVFAKNTGFNLNLGTTVGTVSEGNHSHDEFTDYTSHISDTSIHYTQSEISITESQISNLDKYTQTQTNTLLDDKVDNSRVLTDVPINALFTDNLVATDDVDTKPDYLGNKLRAGNNITITSGYNKGGEGSLLISTQDSLISSRTYTLRESDGIPASLLAGEFMLSNIQSTSGFVSICTYYEDSNGIQVDVVDELGSKNLSGIRFRSSTGEVIQFHDLVSTPISGGGYVTRSGGLKGSTSELIVGTEYTMEFYHDVNEFYLDDYYTQLEIDNLLDGKVDNSRVLTDVPINALFTDTIYELPSSVVIDTDLVDYLKRDGSLPMTGTLDMGSNSIISTKDITIQSSTANLFLLSDDNSVGSWVKFREQFPTLGMKYGFDFGYTASSNKFRWVRVNNGVEVDALTIYRDTGAVTIGHTLKVENGIDSNNKQIKNLASGTELTDAINLGQVNTLLATKENVIIKNTAFNKNFGLIAGTVSEGNHTHDEFTGYDNHINDTSIHFTQSEISIDESQISDLDKYSQSEVDTILGNYLLNTTDILTGDLTVTGEVKASVLNLTDNSGYVESTFKGVTTSNILSIDRYFNETTYIANIQIKESSTTPNKSNFVLNLHNGTDLYEVLSITTDYTYIKNQLNITGTAIASPSTLDTELITQGQVNTIVSLINFEDINNIPTTISGYGITDAYTISEIDGIVGEYTPTTKISNSDDVLFNRVRVDDSWNMDFIYTGFKFGFHNNTDDVGIYFDDEIIKTKRGDIEVTNFKFGSDVNASYFTLYMDDNYITSLKPGISSGHAVEYDQFTSGLSLKVDKLNEANVTTNIITANRTDDTQVAHIQTDGLGSFNFDTYFNKPITVNDIAVATVNDLQSYELISNKNIASGYAGLDSNTKIPLSLLPDTAKQATYVVLDSTEREALTNLIEGDKAFETSTNDSYIWDSSTWVLMADADWENVNIEWTNIVGTPTTISGYGITDTYTITESNSLLDDKYDKTGGLISGDAHIQKQVVNGALYDEVFKSLIIEAYDTRLQLISRLSGTYGSLMDFQNVSLDGLETHHWILHNNPYDTFGIAYGEGNSETDGINGLSKNYYLTITKTGIVNIANELNATVLKYNNNLVSIEGHTHEISDVNNLQSTLDTLALESSLENYVPYTGATDNVLLNSKDLLEVDNITGITTGDITGFVNATFSNTVNINGTNNMIIGDNTMYSDTNLYIGTNSNNGIVHLEAKNGDGNWLTSLKARSNLVEVMDRLWVYGETDVKNNKIINLLDGVLDTDAINLGQVNTIVGDFTKTNVIENTSDILFNRVRSDDTYDTDIVWDGFRYGFHNNNDDIGIYFEANSGKLISKRDTIEVENFRFSETINQSYLSLHMNSQRIQSLAIGINSMDAVNKSQLDAVDANFGNYVPYTGATDNVNLNDKGLIGVSNVIGNSNGSISGFYDGTFSNTVEAKVISVDPTASSSNGISLFGTNVNSYGIQFTTTSTDGYGTHGYVTDSLATYFNMSSNVGRGWIFRNAGSSGGGVASISNTGLMTINGLNMSSNKITELSPGTTSGDAVEYDQVNTIATAKSKSNIKFVYSDTSKLYDNEFLYSWYHVSNGKPSGESIGMSGNNCSPISLENVSITDIRVYIGNAQNDSEAVTIGDLIGVQLEVYEINANDTTLLETINITGNATNDSGIGDEMMFDNTFITNLITPLNINNYKKIGLKFKKGNDSTYKSFLTFNNLLVDIFYDNI